MGTTNGDDNTCCCFFEIKMGMTIISCLSVVTLVLGIVFGVTSIMTFNIIALFYLIF